MSAAGTSAPANNGHHHYHQALQRLAKRHRGRLPPGFHHLTDGKQFDVSYEEREPVELKVTGHIPSYAAGTLFRTGAGPRAVNTKNGRFPVHHWFDSLSINHRFQLIPTEDAKSCRVIYNSRLTCDGLIEKMIKTGDRDNITFGNKYDPCMTLFQKVQSKFRSLYTYDSPSKRPNEISIAITMTYNFPGLSPTGKPDPTGSEKQGVRSLCNKTDANIFQMLDPETLEPIGISRQQMLHPDLKGPISSAHMQTDPHTGDVFNFNLDFVKGKGLYRVFTVEASTGTTSILASVTSDPAYLHSFFLTPNYVVLCVWNAHFTYGGLSMLLTRNMADAMRYEDSKSAKWYVIDRTPPERGGKGLVATYESDAFYCFHSINTYEETTTSADGKTETSIVADACVYRNLDILKKFYLENVVSDSPSASPEKWIDRSSPIHPLIRRYRLPAIPTPSSSTSSSSTNPPKRKATIEFTASEKASIELPTHNPLYATHPYRYVYGCADTGNSTFLDGLLKFDMQTQTVVARWDVRGHSAGEPIFVPRPRVDFNPETAAEGDDEEDGVLLSVVLDCFKGSSYLLVLDAKDLKEVGRAEVGGPIGFGFHGTHFPKPVL